MTARWVMGRPVKDPQRLVLANETVYETRAQLNYGRGNVVPDNEATGGMAAQRSRAGYLAARAKDNQPGATGSHADHLAAAAWALRAGNCAANGNVAARLHGGRLSPGEEIRVAMHRRLGHTWAESLKTGKPPVVMDPWAAGPAMERGDTAWGEPDVYVGIERGGQRFNEENGPQAREDMLAQGARFADGEDRQLLDEAMWDSRRQPTRGRQYAETPLPSEEFSDEAHAALYRDRSGLEPDLAAAHVARDVYGRNAGTAAKQAWSIVESAITLASEPELLPRPPLASEPGLLQRPPLASDPVEWICGLADAFLRLVRRAAGQPVQDGDTRSSGPR